jgi:hypothetical protein
MGVLTDVVIAQPEEASEVCDDINSDKFEWKEFPGLEIPMLISFVSLRKKVVPKGW